MNKEDLLKKINSVNKNSLEETLEIEFIDIGEDFIIAKMPVTSKVLQPDGVLHGGATAAPIAGGILKTYFSHYPPSKTIELSKGKIEVN